MYGFTIFKKQNGRLPDFLNHTDEATRRSVQRLGELLEDYGDDVDAAFLYKALTTQDLARIVAFMITQGKPTQEAATVIDVQDFEICQTFN